jgi:hypothetical protein
VFGGLWRERPERKGRLVRLARILRVLLALSCAGFLVSCDAYLAVGGIVLAWRDAPEGAASVAVLDSPDGFPSGQFTVVEGAQVELLAGAANDSLRSPGSAARRDAVASDSSGHFRTSVVLGPGSLHARVTVNKLGYLPAEVHTRALGRHFVLVALVPER